MSANVYTQDDVDKINSDYIPDEDTEIIRYMNFGKFMNILTFGNLYFTNVNEFEDKYEGKMPEGFFKNWEESAVESYKKYLKINDLHFNAYASCWNELNNTESYALWRIYTESDTGIAIKTTVQKLRNSIKDDRIQIYKVKYVESFEDREEDIEIPFYFPDDGFVRVKQACKISPYSYENEIRALLFSDEKEKGINIAIDVNELIEDIYISPYAGQWFYDLIYNIIKLKEFGLSDKPIIKSKIPL